ncbi:protein-S-isoprenylcysteine methyltransferase [Mycolicibacterium wolinskyi]|uniref:Protein-S-isoprenylcysteine methyltransferase n=1 Tax=Mycolicibacterium wolinskyi TaxID=59750 RepID=A0A132PDW5_9MYCO|nr:isoprenylcysteine carboxylmethyltransferase family protein [Mycolicibacterium wolinskyi]KWX20529.1 protein-S-isoprenylcysteine methyltransferase [Mycolicibacterium wolinskyi]
MAYAALGLFGVLMLVIGAWRRRIQLARTGDSGNRRRWRPDGSLEWWALAIADVGYLLVGVGAPIAALAGLPALGVLDRVWVHGLGIVVAVAGITLTLLAQLGLGASWRIGVDETERTELVTTGPFALVRNPIFTALLGTLTGLALMVPNPAAIAGLVIAAAGIELQVRKVEEPYLRRVHGAAYTNYTAAVGRFLPRFLPRIGRTRPIPAREANDAAPQGN